MSNALQRLEPKSLEPRVYVACLAAYNNGVLHAAWIEVGDDAAALGDTIAAMLAASPVAGAKEYAIHDYADFGGVEIGECDAIDRLVEIAGFLRARGALGAAVLAELCGDLDAAQAALDEQYHGAFDSLAQAFQALTEETVTIPEPLRLYIDYEAMARDARLNSEVFTVETAPGAVHVFWSC